MDNKYIVSVLVFYVIASTYAHNLYLGSEDPRSEIIHSEIHKANPALWVRTENVEVNTSDHHVISAIKVKDLREDGRGEVTVLSGGIGLPFVVIELRSPATLRGYEFEVEVRAKNTLARLQAKGNEYKDGYGYYQETLQANQYNNYPAKI